MTDAPTTSATRLITRGYLMGMSGVIVVRVCGFFFNALLARWLGTGPFGEFVILLAILQFSTLLADAGFSSGVLRFLAINIGKDDEKAIRGSFLTGVYAVFALSVPVIIVLFFSRDTLAHLFHSINLPWLIAGAAPLIGIVVMANLFLSALQGCQKYNKMIVLRDMVEPVVRLVLCAFLVYVGYHLWAALASYLAGQLFLFVSAGVVLLRTLNLRQGSWKITYQMANPIMLFSFPLLFSQLTGALIQWTDTLILGALTASSDVGIYSAAQRWASLGGVPMVGLTPVFLPIISRFYGENKMYEVSCAYKNITSGLIAIGWIILYFTASWAPFLMSLFGEGFQTQESIFVLRLLAFASFFSLATGPTGSLYYMLGRSKMMFYMGLVFASTTIGLNYYCISHWGILGAAAASVAIILLSNVTNVLLLQVLDGIHPYSTNALKIGFIGALMAFLSWEFRWLLPNPFFWEVIVWFLIYPMVILFICSREDVRKIRRLIFSSLAFFQSPKKTGL